MHQRRMAVMCIQETHVKGAHHFKQDGYLVILSGAAETLEGKS